MDHVCLDPADILSQIYVFGNITRKGHKIITGDCAQCSNTERCKDQCEYLTNAHLLKMGISIAFRRRYRSGMAKIRDRFNCLGNSLYFLNHSQVTLILNHFQSLSFAAYIQALTAVIEALGITIWKKSGASYFSCHSEWLIPADREAQLAAVVELLEVTVPARVPEVQILKANDALLNKYFKSGSPLVTKISHVDRHHRVLFCHPYSGLVPI